MAAPDIPLFCPFCRECFEGETHCPDHELGLVSFEDLPPDPTAARPPRDDEELVLHEWRHGRGIVLAAALTMLVGFAMPFLHAVEGERQVTESAFALSLRAPILWMVPGVAVAMVFILMRRRTVAALRGVRLAVPVLCVLAGSSMAYTVWRAFRLAELTAEDMTLTVQPGLYVMAAGCIVGMLGGTRLGSVPGSGSGIVPHGASPAGGSAIVMTELEGARESDAPAAADDAPRPRAQVKAVPGTPGVEKARSEADGIGAGRPKRSKRRR